ncbi:type II secretion system protein N [Ramlibacter albus]|uniref:type II secretion system protein N n=1 Tax=Ramlibacter albus TaxID=2079448 RepID=UPI002106723A|nr:type II secretion system protein N [Ramlibacter albus]
MSTAFASNWTVRGASFALWALAAASAVYWGMKFSARPAPAAAPAVPARSAPPVDPQAVARLLGANPMAASASAAPVATLASRFALVGVAAQGAGKGAALVAVDGKPPKPYRVGAQLDEGIVLQSVQGRKAVLASTATGQPVLTLELPPPTAATSQPALPGQLAPAVQRPPPMPIPTPAPR